jgi:hypothetical protein
MQLGTRSRTPEKNGCVKHDKASECGNPGQRRNMKQSKRPGRNQRPGDPGAGRRHDGGIDCLGGGSGDEFMAGMTQTGSGHDRQCHGSGRSNHLRVHCAGWCQSRPATLFAVGLSISDAFKGIAFKDDSALASSLFYLSFVTLTSTGYGDIIPVHPLARSLCNIESIVGQLYPAMILARLVTLELRADNK